MPAATAAATADPLALPLLPGLTTIRQADPEVPSVDLHALVIRFLSLTSTPLNRPWNPSALARAAQLHRRSVIAFLYGRYRPSLELGLKISTAMGIPPHAVLTHAKAARARRMEARGKNPAYRYKPRTGAQRAIRREAVELGLDPDLMDP